MRPFSILPIEDVTAIGFELTGNASYSVALDSAPLAGKVVSASSGHGKLSPFSHLTLDGASRMVAKIPLSAARFAFGYPLDAQCPNPDDLNDGCVASCVLGFFVYVDAQEKVCGMNGLGYGDGLFFMGPFKLWTLRVPSLRAYLHEADRVAPVTIAALGGARSFCWVGPSEDFSGLVDAAVAARSWGHGAFFYFFAEAEHKKDCFYSIDEAPQTAIDKAAERRASVGAGGIAACCRALGTL